MPSERDGVDIPRKSTPEYLGAEGGDRWGVRSYGKQHWGNASPDHRGPEKASRGRQGAKEACRQEPTTRSVLHRGERGQGRGRERAHWLDPTARPELQWLLSPFYPSLWPLLPSKATCAPPWPSPTMTWAPWTWSPPERPSGPC